MTNEKVSCSVLSNNISDRNILYLNEQMLCSSDKHSRLQVASNVSQPAGRAALVVFAELSGRLDLACLLFHGR